MPRPRRSQVSVEDTPMYHCCSRVVRRAYLCGDDKFSGKNYDHRRGWVEAQLLKLAEVFAIDVAAYAVMSNHLHVVLSIDIYQANRWTDIEVINHWHQLFKGTEITQKFAKGETLEDYEALELSHTTALYRSRLSDISWFMRALNEPIARRANEEDECTGRFWEGRFKSQALLDEAAVLACMVYVDLNPIRSKIAKTPESSDFTSIKRRITAALNGTQPKALLPFVGNDRKDMPKGLTFHLKDYLQLVEDTGKAVRDDKRGSISHNSQSILNRLNIPADNWLKIINEFGRLFKGPVGTLQELTAYCEHLEKRRRHYCHACQYIAAS
jgi:REP element-mobilizing transposase RayT